MAVSGPGLVGGSGPEARPAFGWGWAILVSGRDPEVRPKARPQESGRRHQEAKKPLRKRQGRGGSPRAAGSPAPAGCCWQAGHRHAPFPRGGLAVTPPSPNIQMVLSAPAPPSSQGRARPALPKVSPCHPSHPTPHTFLPRAHFSVVRCTREQIRLHTQHCVAGSSQTQNAGLPSRRRASGAAPVPWKLARSLGSFWVTIPLGVPSHSVRAVQTSAPRNRASGDAALSVRNHYHCCAVTTSPWQPVHKHHRLRGAVLTTTKTEGLWDAHARYSANTDPGKRGLQPRAGLCGPSPGVTFDFCPL